MWADQSRNTCQWAQIYYRAKRDKGHSHASALRCLGKRWLKVLWRMWQDRVPYDESIHLRSLKEHGSFVASLLAPQPLQTAHSNVNNFYEKALYNTENISGAAFSRDQPRAREIASAPLDAKHFLKKIIARWKIRLSDLLTYIEACIGGRRGRSPMPARAQN